jgi:acetolactate synthase-1/2/3 large subunit
MTTVAQLVARELARRGVQRVYGLTGSHVKPIWDELTRLGVDIVGVRHEVAAVHMAHAAAEVTGHLGVAIVTAGPGLTNAVSGIATAQHARAPVLVLSALAPTPQLGRGAFEETPQREIVAPVCRSAATVWRPDQALEVLDTAIATARGEGGASPGPAYVDAPVDVLRAAAATSVQRAEMTPPLAHPDAEAIVQAAALIAQARRPLVISGHGAKGSAPALQAFVESLGGLYLDTRETRGLLPTGLPAYVPAMRGRAMREADLIITVGRRLDYELAYGSPAVFGPGARFLRIGSTAEHLRDNRPGDAEIHADVGQALSHLTAALGARELDTDWTTELQTANGERVARLASTMASHPPGDDGRMHPYRLLAALNDVIDDDTIVVADGGDILSFAAVGLRARTLLTPGPFGCIGVGVPFAVAAAVECPARRVLAVVGDGAFGFNALELDTAVRQRAPVVIVVANNEAWGIERRDRIENYADAPFSTELPGCRYDLLAQALGAYGERVEDAADLDDALQRAFANAPAVLDVAVTRDAISPDFKNGLADLGDHQALRAWNDLELAWRSNHGAGAPAAAP